MIIHSEPLLTIYFGDARTSLGRSVFENAEFSHPALNTIKNTLNLETIIFFKQIHSNKGTIVNQETIYQEGDFLLTNILSIGLAIYTADCLPIIFYDIKNRAIGICHAGWPGSVSHIAQKTLAAMQETFATDTRYLRIFFGPSAKACCYEVTPDFAQQLNNFSYADQVLITLNDKLYFDLPLFNKLQLESMGVKKKSLCQLYNKCTICDLSFCSYRRQGAQSQRQLTIVALK